MANASMLAFDLKSSNFHRSSTLWTAFSRGSLQDAFLGRVRLFFSPRFRRTDKPGRQPLRPGCSKTLSCSCWKECDKGRPSACPPVGETAPCPRDHGDAGRGSLRWAADDLRMPPWQHRLTSGWEVNQSVSGAYGLNLRPGDSPADNRHANYSCPAIDPLAQARRANL